MMKISQHLRTRRLFAWDSPLERREKEPEGAEGKRETSWQKPPPPGNKESCSPFKHIDRWVALCQTDPWCVALLFDLFRDRRWSCLFWAYACCFHFMPKFPPILSESTLADSRPT